MSSLLSPLTGSGPRLWGSGQRRWRRRASVALRPAVVRLACALLLAFAMVPAFAQTQPQTQPQAQPQSGAPVALPAGVPAPAGGQPPGPAAVPPAAAAQPAPPALPTPVTVSLPPEMVQPVERLAKSIEGAETAIQHLHQLEEELAGLRTNVESILNEATQTAEGLRPKLAEVRALIEKLGSVPAAGQPPEAPAIAAERARLNALAAQIDGAIKTTELTWARARQLIEKITVMRHAIFTRNLLERLPSPLLPALWRDVINDSPAVGRRLAYLTDDWWSWAHKRGAELAALLVVSVVVFFVLTVAVRRLVARGMRGYDARGRAHGGHVERGTATFFERAVAVGWMAPARMVPAIVALLLIYGGLDALDLLFPPWDRLGSALAKAALAFVAITTLIAAALAPGEPGWRLVPLTDRSAQLTNRIAAAMVGVYAADFALTEMSRAFFVPLALSVVQSFIMSLAFAGLLIALALTRVEWAPIGTEAVAVPGADGSADGSAEGSGASIAAPVPSRLHPRWLKLPLWALAIGIVAASMLGYVALGRFAAHQLVLTGLVLGVCGLGYLAIRALTRVRGDGRYAMADVLEHNFGLDVPRQRQLARLAEVALTFALLLAALPILLLQWGFQAADIKDWAKSAIFGFEVGHLRISLARILIGIVLFTALLFLTRLFQKWLREGVLTQARMDVGISHSIDQAVGYSGIALALLLAVSYAGFDITSLAIVAGALSVGIGFGLQSIVNNFVSGLILLVERPIKVGDWIALGDQQGNVRRISVRSTEIETFDKASLIVPNSELISGRVLNWTHRNLLGRVVIKFSLDGAADPEQVLAIMQKCARAHPQVMKSPEPIATLDTFSPMGLDFALRVTINDVNRGLFVLTDLRVALLRELRAAGQISAMSMQPPVLTALPA